MSPTRELATRAGISLSYASEIITGKRKLGLVAALNIYRRCGLKLGPLADMPDEAVRMIAGQTATAEG